ncbi:fluoride efflux transporter CrcB [Salinimicrobium oceani]|uniref:Fluoride-specific ion channel FluC n=1 Tax=Salinimicrobium oceani TaxID=2722702 RepID=A0ABX1CZM7_9FLAO|nr:fluoride efflux transporter CrcB [Salinimicrobium oceani]NJW53712.1 fluoride efflux transporter CrcB [Salinimicrobium oceani]
MKQVFLVFLGGGAGSVLRYLVSSNLNPAYNLPMGTFLVNITGSLIIGLVLGLGLKQELLSPNTSLFLATGFCGGFTTFSAFSYENQQLLKTGDFLHFGIYAAGSIVLGIAAVLLGLYLARLLEGFL